MACARNFEHRRIVGDFWGFIHSVPRRGMMICPKNRREPLSDSIRHIAALGTGAKCPRCRCRCVRPSRASALANMTGMGSHDAPAVGYRLPAARPPASPRPPSLARLTSKILLACRLLAVSRSP